MNYCIRYILVILCTISCTISLQAQSPTGQYRIRKIVLDPGHGGRDPGVVGKTLHEKNIVLAVALKAGKLIKEQYPDVEIIYTRDKDVFVDVAERGNIANRHNADLFISIHVNSILDRTKTNVGGYETYIMGTEKNSANMNVVTKENAVITYEKDYSTKYEGYDPKNPESFIIFSMYQNAHLDQSVKMAELMQAEMKNTPIKTNRGVRQGPLLVLWRTAMPSILVELGFLSNPTEENAMKKESTLNSFAKAIADAFSNYKTYYEKRHKGAPEASIPTTISTTDKTANTPLIYCVQVFVSPSKDITNSKEAKALKDEKDVRCIPAGKLFKYTVGSYNTLQEAQEACKKLQKKFAGAFVVGLEDGAIVQIKR